MTNTTEPPMTNITDQSESLTHPLTDTPRDPGENFPRHDELPYARELAQSARSAWRSATPLLAGTPHIQASADGGRSYRAKHTRPLPAEPPAGQPCTIPVFDPGSGCSRHAAVRQRLTLACTRNQGGCPRTHDAALDARTPRHACRGAELNDLAPVAAKLRRNRQTSAPCGAAPLRAWSPGAQEFRRSGYVTTRRLAQHAAMPIPGATR